MTEEYAALNVSFIFLLHPYSFFAITDTRSGKERASNDLWKAICIGSFGFEGTTHSANEFELPQCTGRVRDGGSRSLWAFPAAPSGKRVQ